MVAFSKWCVNWEGDGNSWGGGGGEQARKYALTRSCCFDAFEK